MNVNELRATDPKRFEKEYQAWTNYAVGYQWWDCIYDDFREDCNAAGVRVDDIEFSGFYSQGDGAAFSGRVYVCEWMEKRGFNVTHPAAYIACKDDGSYVRLEIGSRNNMRTNFDGPSYLPYPSGIFTGLDQHTWEDLVNDQLGDLNVEDEVLGYCEAMADKLYKDLRHEYESLTSEEAFIDSCELNEVTFEESEDAISA